MYKRQALDAITTWEVHKPILAQAKKVSRSGTLLTHDIQVKAAYALAAVERNGCYLNVDKVEALRTCCLLYTSDAADERSSVDLGGRRIINKKK